MWIESKYIGLVSSQLDRFKRVGNNTFNFRCPLCGDSKKDRTKARGYLYNKESNYIYHCHNCHETLGFDNFLKTVDHLLHDEYKKESLLEKFKPREKSDVELFAEKMKKPVFIKTTALNTLKKISQLVYNHPAKLYIEKRKIPNKFHSKLFYTPKFKKFVNKIIPNKFENTDYDEPRLIIPFLSKEKEMFAFQGRSFSSKGLRYITIILDESMPKIFGLDRLDVSIPHYVFEGPIDSMFVENAIAMAGQDIDISICNENTIFVFDNEPRNPATCKKIEKAIEHGYSVVIFPKTITQKDINDIVLHTSIDIQSLLVDNTYSGMSARIAFMNWKKI